MTEQQSNESLVSVIIPAYNSAEFMGETLDSVFAQTYTPVEVIVINDGSRDTPELEQVLQRYSAKNLRYIKQENQGAAAARNTGIRTARGEFVAFLDADDTWLPVFLEKQLELLERTPADVVWADALICGDSPLAGLATGNRALSLVHPEVYLARIESAQSLLDEYRKLRELLEAGKALSAVRNADGTLTIRVSDGDGRG